MFNKVNLIKDLSVASTNYLILKLLVELDGNISLRYFSDEVYKIYQFEDELFITINYIIFFIVTFIFVTKLIVKNIGLNITSNFSNYTLIFFIYSSCLLISLLFLRIFDIERLFLLIYILLIPIVDIFIEKYLNVRSSLISVFIVFTLTYLLFQFTNDNELNELFASEETIEDIQDEENHSNVETKVISEFDLSTEYRFTRTEICCDQIGYYEAGGKSLGYFEIIDDKLLHVTGNGIFTLYDIEKIIEKVSQIPKILETNFFDIVKNPFIKNLENWESTKDILIMKNEIFVSYVEEASSDCTNVQILKAELNLETLYFEKFFEYDECAQRGVSPYNAHQSGGKLLMFDDKTIAFTTGDFRRYGKSQDPESLFGKILLINIETKQYEFLSTGHRNPQGLSKTNNSEYLISTEHGPKGGDEINIIEIGKENNFGWPISSYGDHYDGLNKPEAPLNKSHTAFGFREPAWYFSRYQSDIHGISDIEINYFNEENSFFIGTLKAGLLYEIKADLENNTITNIETFKIGDRIRDIIFYEKKNSYIFLLEEWPAFGVLQLKENDIMELPYILPNT